MTMSRFWKIKTTDGKDTYACTNYKVTKDSFKSTFCDLVQEVSAISEAEYVEATGDDI